METHVSDDRTINGTQEKKEDLPVTKKGMRKAPITLTVGINANEENWPVITLLCV